jgi:hypothetical protein
MGRCDAILSEGEVACRGRGNCGWVCGIRKGFVSWKDWSCWMIMRVKLSLACDERGGGSAANLRDPDFCRRRSHAVRHSNLMRHH